MIPKLNCCHVDTCLPDYWPGDQRAHISIPVYPGMKLKEIKEALRGELAQGAVMGSSRLAYLLSADWVAPQDEGDAIAATRRAHAAINRLAPVWKYQKRFFLDLPKTDDDDADSVYAFFVFVECD